VKDDSGFQIVPGVFAPAELAPVLAAIEADVASRSRAGARHLLRLPPVYQFAEDARLLAIAGEFLKESARPFRATLFDKSADANWLVVWHQDTALPLCRRVESPEWGPWSRKAGVLYAHAPAPALARIVALRVHFDDSTSANGPLRVLPDTHGLGLLSDEAIVNLVKQVAPVECQAAAGSVVGMRPLLVHSSSKSREPLPRRVLHIEYAADTNISPGIELAVA
jgi:hypothetical protein